MQRQCSMRVTSLDCRGLFPRQIWSSCESLGNLLILGISVSSNIKLRKIGLTAKELAVRVK